MKKNWIRKLIGGLSFTSALFVFQACYGTPQDFGVDLLIEGQVTSKINGLPIEGIKVAVPAEGQYQLTDTDGRFSFYTGIADTVLLRFTDIDSVDDGAFLTRDTVLTDLSEQVYLEIVMEEN